MYRVKKEIPNEELAKKFQFLLFENFDGCREFYIQGKERKLVTKVCSSRRFW